MKTAICYCCRKKFLIIPPLFIAFCAGHADVFHDDLFLGYITMCTGHDVCSYKCKILTENPEDPEEAKRVGINDMDAL